MENTKWNNAKQLIREQLRNPDIYDTWFADVECERYDEATNTLTLRVPNVYIYKCLEHFCLRILSQAIEKTYQPGAHLQYRIAQKEPSFSEVAEYLQQLGFKPASGNVRISVPDARKRLEDGLKYFLGKDAYKWLPAYEKVADWLSDNKGRGLLCVGTSGLGKTLICQRILPVIIGSNIPSVTAQEMNARIDDLLKERCVIVDDLGKEEAEIKYYGNRRHPFFELCDAAEKNGNILIINPNLSTTPVRDPRYPDSIQSRYGNEVLSRLRATTKAVLFEGEDMRG